MTTLILAGATLPDVIQGATNPAAVYIASQRSPRGRDVVRGRLDRVAAMFGQTWDSLAWHELSYAHVQAITSALADQHKPSYVNGILSAVKGTMRHAWHLGLISADAHLKIADIRGVRGQALQQGRYLTPGERGALIGACVADESRAGYRDAAMLACAYPGGLRRAEIVGLNVEDLDDDGQTITLRVRGKGRKEREVPIDNGGADAIRDWLKVRGDRPGALFWAGRRGGHLMMDQRITSQSFYEMLAKRAAEAGVADLSPHDLRRTTASDLLDETDAITTARLLGHASTATTMAYDRRGDRAVRKAAGKLHLPYRRRRLV